MEISFLKIKAAHFSNKFSKFNAIFKIPLIFNLSGSPQVFKSPSKRTQFLQTIEILEEVGINILQLLRITLPAGLLFTPSS
jgi:hypothetical protein